MGSLESKAVVGGSAAVLMAGFFLVYQKIQKPVKTRSDASFTQWFTNEMKVIEFEEGTISKQSLIDIMKEVKLEVNEKTRIILNNYRRERRRQLY